MGAAGPDLGDEEIISGINVTPLVDIVLVLLIIFMVTTTYIVNPSIKVDLPKAATGDETTPSTVSVVVTREGALYVNGRKSDEQSLDSEVRRRVKLKPDLQVVIAADAMALHGQVVHVVDLVKAAGVTRFAINTQPVEPPKPQAEAPPPGDAPG